MVTSFIFTTGCDVSGTAPITDPREPQTQEPDPLVVNIAIAFIERPTPLDEDGELIAADILAPLSFNPGARLVFKEKASTSAAEIVLTDQAFIDTPEETPDGEEASEELLKELKKEDDAYQGGKIKGRAHGH